MSHSEFEVIGNLRFRRKVRALVQNRRGDLLLIQPHGYVDSWTLVGGGIEKGESPEVAILRELREELGVTSISELRPLQLRHSFCFSENQKMKRGLDHDGQVAILFWALLDDNVAIALQAEEVKAYTWIRPAELDSHVRVPKQLNLLRSALQELGKSSSVNL